jgi:transcriptional regulator with XRE-family HTH domain
MDSPLKSVEPSLGDLVAARRHELRLSQASLAAACHVSQKTISLIESGQTREPRLSLLGTMAVALGLPRSKLERCLPASAVGDAPASPAAAPRPVLSRFRAEATPASLQRARQLRDTLLSQVVNHRDGAVVDLVHQTASYLAAEFGDGHRTDHPTVELAIDSTWIVGRTYANVLKRRPHEGDAYFDRAATLARGIRDWDRWAQAVWRKANHHRKLDDLVVACDRSARDRTRADYDLALIWLDNVVSSRASAAWRSVAHAECAKIAISTNRETLFAEHIQEARRLAATATESARPPDWPPFLHEYAEVLWRDRYLLGMAVFGEGTDAEMGRLVEEARQFRNGLTAPFDRVMLPLSQMLRDIRSGDALERERGAGRGWRIILRARAMGLDNFAGLAAQALREAGLFEVGRRVYEAEARARKAAGGAATST